MVETTRELYVGLRGALWGKAAGDKMREGLHTFKKRVLKQVYCFPPLTITKVLFCHTAAFLKGLDLLTFCFIPLLYDLRN